MRISDWSSDVCSSDLCLPPSSERVPASSILSPSILLHQHVGKEFRQIRFRRGFREIGCVGGDLPDFLFERFEFFLRNTRIQQGWFKAFDKIGQASCRERVGQYV